MLKPAPGFLPAQWTMKMVAIEICFFGAPRFSQIGTGPMCMLEPPPGFQLAQWTIKTVAKEIEKAGP